MSEIHVVVRGSEDEPLTQMAVAALEATAAQRGLQLTVRVVADGDVGESALFVADAPGGASPSALTATRAEAVRHTRDLLARLVPEEAMEEEVEAPPEPEPVEAAPSVFLVGVTSCPTGVAHTFMAAEALRRGATALGYEIAVETRGSVGASNELTPEQIARADAVVVAADANVETTRFAGKRLLETGTKAAIHDAQSVIQEALALPEPAAGSAAPAAPARPARTGVYKHLMTGVSHMLPLVVAGGLMIALGFAVGGIYAGEAEGTLGWALMQIGASAAFALFVPILAGFIAFSIADRPGLTPGLIGGMLAASVGAGFLGGIVAGFLAGYLTRWLNQTIKLPENLQGLKPVLILPLLSSLVVGLAMIFLIGPPVKALLVAMTAWLSGMQTGSALVLGVLLGAMMAFDMGGPINKAAYTFAVGMVSNEVYAPMAAVMAAGMTPPLGLALAATLFKNRFTADEQRAAKAAGVLGLSFITEGAIPFAAADPIRVIPSIAIGSAVSGALSMMWGCQLLVPHGGIFVLAIPNAITHAMLYLAAILAGTATTAVALYVLKRPQPLAA
jgi:PTS system fructose-specific IIC component